MANLNQFVSQHLDLFCNPTKKRRTFFGAGSPKARNRIQMGR
jgi:hypothetical protein